MSRFVFVYSVLWSVMSVIVSDVICSHDGKPIPSAEVQVFVVGICTLLTTEPKPP